MKRILLVDDHSIVRQGMKYVIKSIIAQAEIFNADDVKSAIELIKTSAVDFIFLDISFPDQNISTTTVELMKHILPNAKITIFSAMDEEIYASRFIKAGADGFINKLSSDEELFFALDYFFKNGRYISENIKSKIIDDYLNKKTSSQISLLSDKELEVSQFIIKGYSTSSIAKTMNLKKSTISTYKKRIYEKLEISNIAELFEIFSII
ncbi:response regulator transcription factor [Chryseobacterium gambrini]|jgi:DNA-binding NarL/FixJ family response regulator|uniref:Response regulator transcription factor n=2 Tax=Chryseobacterium TaxID=59732 RepID=A0AAJ1VP06_9FLAO|nr:MULTISPECIES: response regulator transcription factor [Chryseobacterium]MCF2221178.1 response regulator transcription factor [Chryseobacterium sp. PS-8]MDN4014449.1 response regulator transcription factor [Chryseobacterium gambrini]MDN4029796.1 response regulator transcription factor [Chryseobacterium gambrini]QWA37228.1 response regulator transcription factor [Chryseobacterium sp. ZHDP1]